MVFLDIGHDDVYPVIKTHPNVDILSIHQYEKLYVHLLFLTSTPMSTFYQLTSMRSYMMEDASPVIDIHPNVDILSTHQYEKLYMMEDASGGTQTSSC